MSAEALGDAFRAFFEDVSFGSGFREGFCLPCNLPRRPEPAYTGSSMEHPLFLFNLVYPKWNAHPFPTREAAEEFAKDIRESRVTSGDDYGRVFVVQVGPWMFASDVKPRKYP